MGVHDGSDAVKKHTLAEMATRLWAKVEKTGHGDCWLWTGLTNDRGYGFIWTTTESAKRFQCRTRRLSYQLRYGSIPQGMIVETKCKNKLCVNPLHLFLESRADLCDRMNQEDQRNALYWQGSKNVNSKLTEKEVLEIRAAVDMTPSALGIKYGVHRCTINHVLYRRTWKHI